jgi:valyl-tRNA synthetase
MRLTKPPRSTPKLISTISVNRPPETYFQVPANKIGDLDADARQKLEETTRWQPGEAEGRIFQEWLDGGYFHPEATGTADENFSVAIPPPNVTGVLHMGHALNGSMQDALVRMNRMAGKNTLWILGMDHAGIATQSVVEKRLKEEGIDRHEIGREDFVERVWTWKEDYAARIKQQYMRMGASVDYERERFTLDDDYAKAVRKVFVSLFEKGYIYRDNYMVNWDPGSQSAISDLEVVNREETDTLFSVDYPVEGTDRVLTVATVRPETMMADTAVAVNPNDERYGDLVGKFCILPLVGRRLPIIADEHVDIEFGTGALKITPGHDVNDFEIGRKHGLDEISVIDEDGRMTDEAGERFAGMSVAEAQVAVAEALREEGVLSAEEEYVHSVPFSERSGERIEPLISLQWFCKMDELAVPAIAAVENGDVNITPGQWKRVYLDWMREIRPWCVSRQLWWGHQIPVWYRDDEVYAGEEAPEGDGWVQEEDVLDTWFSSAIWPFATLGWPEETAELKAFYPTDFLTTAREILFLWVARMVMTGIEFAGDIPFRDVYVHSVIQARDGRRMSKSLGTGIDPLGEIDEHGADALRFGLLAMSSTQDVRYSDAKVQQGRDLSNKLWNASRLILMNTDEPVDRSVPASPKALEDRWILSRLESTIASVTALLDEYDFAHAAQELYSFVFSDLCDWYLEIAKPRIYDESGEVAQVLLHALERTLSLVHPVMPFVTEEIWRYHPYRDGHLVVHAFPESDGARRDAAVEVEVGTAIALTRQLRGWRDMAGVPPKIVLGACGGKTGVPEFVSRLSRVTLGEPEGEVVATVAGYGILPSEGLDMEALTARLTARKGKLEVEAKKIEGKLANERFVDKAPAEVVAEEREKLERIQAELSELG